jgi:hypothetical protein
VQGDYWRRKKLRGWSVAQVLEHSFRKYKALGSIPDTTEKLKRGKGRGGREGRTIHSTTISMPSQELIHSPHKIIKVCAPFMHNIFNEIPRATIQDSYACSLFSLFLWAGKRRKHFVLALGVETSSNSSY